MQAEADAIIEVRFLTLEEGGLSSPPFVGDYYRPDFDIDGEFHAGSFLGAGRRMELGVTYEAPVIFVCTDLVLPKLVEGKLISILRGKKVATGKVIRVLRRKFTN